MESQSETTQTVSALKLPVLKTRDYDLWSMRMEQYLTHTDYALWEVIVNGDCPAIDSSTGTEGGHAYHEGEKILKEDMKESEFQWKETVGLYNKTKVDVTTASGDVHLLWRSRALRNQGIRNQRCSKKG
ncbi:hypothetical protein Tco_0093356 [Tanacetum coccineum]